MRKLSVFLLAISCYLMIATTANATIRSGMFRLSLDHNLFRVATGEIDRPGAPPNEFTVTSVGLGLPNAGIGFGGTFGSGWVFGVRTVLGLEGEDRELSGADSFKWAGIAYIEYVFLSGVFRPFVTAHAGFEGTVRNLGENNESHLWGFCTGGGGGAHIFFGHLSLDFSLLATYSIGRQELQPNPPRELDWWRFQVYMLFGLSGWFG